MYCPAYVFIWIFSKAARPYKSTLLGWFWDWKHTFSIILVVLVETRFITHQYGLFTSRSGARVKIRSNLDY